MNNKYFYCYNPIKKNFILEHGESYIDSDTNISTGRKYWIFVRNNKLNTILIQWRKFQETRFKKE